MANAVISCARPVSMLTCRRWNSDLSRDHPRRAVVGMHQPQSPVLATEQTALLDVVMLCHLVLGTKLQRRMSTRGWPALACVRDWFPGGLQVPVQSQGGGTLQVIATSRALSEDALSAVVEQSWCSKTWYTVQPPRGGDRRGACERCRAHIVGHIVLWPAVGACQPVRFMLSVNFRCRKYWNPMHISPSVSEMITIAVCRCLEPRSHRSSVCRSFRTKPGKATA